MKNLQVSHPCVEVTPGTDLLIPLPGTAEPGQPSWQVQKDSNAGNCSERGLPSPDWRAASLRPVLSSSYNNVKGGLELFLISRCWWSSMRESSACMSLEPAL